MNARGMKRSAPEKDRERLKDKEKRGGIEIAAAGTMERE